MERWAAGHLGSLPAFPQIFDLLLPVTTAQFWAATVLIDLSVLTIACLYMTGWFRGIVIYLLLGVQSIMFLNSLSHLFLALYFFDYQPGLATGLLLNLPFSGYLLRSAIQGEYIRKRPMIVTFVLSAVIYPLSAGMFLVMGKAMLKII